MLRRAFRRLIARAFLYAEDCSFDEECQCQHHVCEGEGVMPEWLQYPARVQVLTDDDNRAIN